eukprot:TRINITY_DN4913_c0_g1_i11.p1 TRINITY_DN4913_c0_g1~~TRINITY_DN4913_c0_g1_i11.p1  ORF type:complete len:112 (-),score=27.36 TRINITY_DN4913_c0_g1_i11:259-594(-)
MSVDSLQFFIENLGLDELSSEDMDALIQAADVDQDGRISLEDFRNMITANAHKYLDFNAPEFEGLNIDEDLSTLMREYGRDTVDGLDFTNHHNEAGDQGAKGNRTEHPPLE